MKLLLCKKCHDVFKLDFEERQCKCGSVRGKYLSELYAIYSGEHAVPLGFNNQSLVDAIISQPKVGRGVYFEAFVVPKVCSTFRKDD